MANPIQYEYQKVIGKRSESGELKLRKLLPRHKSIIAFHLQGWSNRDIAHQMNMDEIAVGRVLRDPLSQNLINRYMEMTDDELRALMPKTVASLRRGLEHPDIHVQMKAADKVLKTQGKYNEKEGGRETAEDVIARALERVAETNQSLVQQVERQHSLSNVIDITPSGSEEDNG